MKNKQKILISEEFLSCQGEGRYVGVPSVFLRVFGCNFTCAGFGQERNNIIPIEEMPHNKFDPSEIKSIEDLPIFDIGCDSSAAWNKKYRHLSTSYNIKDLIEVIQSHYDNTKRIPHLVITGGEPLLPKYQRFWADMFLDDSFEFGKITFETNGSQKIIPELRESLIKKKESLEVTFSVSPKLSISGEPRDKAIVPEAVQSYRELNELYNINSYVYLKFVTRDEQCLNEAIDVVESFGFSREDCYLMPEGATDKGLSITERKVADLALENGFNFSPRLHIQLYGNCWGT